MNISLNWLRQYIDIDLDAEKIAEAFTSIGLETGGTWEDLIPNRLRLRLFGAVQNPFVITKYKGLDPEVFSGIDNNVYPRPVTFTLGVIATF